MDMDLQLFIVIIIGIIVGIILLRQLHHFFFIQKDHTRCGGCNMCDLPKRKRESHSPVLFEPSQSIQFH